MPAFIRALLLIAAAIPAFALSLDDVNGTWQVNGEAVWAEMEKDPAFQALPKDEVAAKKPAMMAQFANLRFTIAGEVITIAAIDGSGKDSGTLKAWTSTGATTASVTMVDKQGSENPAVFEKADASTLRMTMEENGHKMVMVFNPATEAAPAAPATGAAPAK